jgi:hypothetical protein
METDTSKMCESWRDKMKKSRVEYLVPFLLLGILSACGGEDSEVVSPAAVGIAAPGGVAAVPSQ